MPTSAAPVSTTSAWANVAATRSPPWSASTGQITVISYGEERPTCADSTEDCWSRNRRVEIVYTTK